MDSNVNLDEFSDVVWLFANNIDPERDMFYAVNNEGKKLSKLIIDGSRKTLKFDDFQRPWPNVVVVDDDTIRLVDSKWEKYGLGEFIKSPSLKYKSLLFKGGAVAEEE